jgi:nitroreductase
MNVEDAIRTRRSIRHYKADSIPREIIEKLILNAAIWAPSGGNCQYWRFDIVDEPTLLAKVKMLSPGMLGNPPVVVVICQDEQKVKEKWGDIGTHLSAMDSAMAGQNLMLAAHSQGFGTCAILSRSCTTKAFEIAGKSFSSTPGLSGHTCPINSSTQKEGGRHLVE